MNQDFCFQQLRVYQQAKAVLALVIAHREAFRGLPGEVAVQLHRAAVSTALNIAEGAGRVSAADQRRHYQIALGSANEVAACAEIAGLHGVAAPVIAEMLERLAHVVRMLLAMCRPR